MPIKVKHDKPCEVEISGRLCGNTEQAGWMTVFPGTLIPICHKCWTFYADAFPESVQELPR